MTLRHLTIFSEVCHQLSITKAADRLNMSQPAVSTAIRELESYYQTRLFERMNRRLYLTQAGEYLLHHADAVLAELDETKKHLADAASAAQIRIGSNVSFGQSYLADIITSFRQKYPDIPVLVTIQNSGSVEELLLRNQLDFAIADDLSDSESFHRRLLLSEDVVAACSPDCAFLPDIIPPESLSRVPLLLREKGRGSRTVTDQLLRAYGVNATIAAESISTQILIEFALRGHGLLLLPRAVLAPYFSAGALVPVAIAGVSLSRSYYLVYHRSKFLTQSMRRFLAHLDKQWDTDTNAAFPK